MSTTPIIFIKKLPLACSLSWTYGRETVQNSNLPIQGPSCHIWLESPVLPSPISRFDEVVESWNNLDVVSSDWTWEGPVTKSWSSTVSANCGVAGAQASCISLYIIGSSCIKLDELLVCPVLASGSDEALLSSKKKKKKKGMTDIKIVVYSCYSHEGNSKDHSLPL